MTIGRGNPMKAINQRTAPNEKNQNSSPAQSRCVTVARAKTVKNVRLRIAQTGSKKIATTNFTHRVGTTSESGTGTTLVVDTKRGAIFTRPRDLRPRYVFDLRFVAAKVIGRLRRLTQVWERQIRRT